MGKRFGANYSPEMGRGAVEGGRFERRGAVDESFFVEGLC